MHNLTEKHSAAVSAANHEHLAALMALREKSDAVAREAIATFGQQMLDLVKQANDAHENLIASLSAMTAAIAAESEEAFAQNIAAISLSAADTLRELEARAEFLKTGVLPVSDPLPKAEAPPPAQEQGNEPGGQSDEAA